MKIGVCTGIENAAQVRAAGFDYLEPSVVSIAAMSGGDFEKAAAAVKEAGIACEAFNVMLPGDLKVVGPEVDTARLKAHLAGVFPRLAVLGGAVVVFGSGGARKVPDGFDPKKARDQYVQAVRIASEEAVKHGLVIAVEPLNTGETNLVNSVADGLAIVREAARPGTRLLADFYHMRRENEPYGAIVEAGALMAHAHIARTEGRLIPQDEAEDEYGKFFAALKAAGYQGRVSVEGKIENLLAQAPAALRLLRKLARA